MAIQAAKETKIDVQVIGFTSYWGGEPQLRIRISGQGPKGKLKGLVTVQDGRLDFKGDGQYSFMHGNSSLSYREEPRMEIERRAKVAAEEWLAANPNALHAHRIDVAKAKVAGLQDDIVKARETLARKEAQLAQAEESLQGLTVGAHTR